MMTVARDH